MRLLVKKYSPKKGPACYTFVLISIHAAVMMGILLFCDVKYEVSDDFVMELIASGAFNGTPDAHLMFCSYLWGQLLSVFYKLFSGISWYFWAQIAVCFLSCCAVSYYLANTMHFSLSILITVLISAFFSRDMYLLLQFTKTAAIAIASGTLLFVWGLFHEKGKGCLLGGASLAIAGCLIRHNAMFIVGAYLFIYVCFETICLIRRNQAGVWKKIVRIYFAGGILLFLIFALRWCNHMAYKCNESYRYYIDYSYARALIVDYPLPDYSVCASELEKIGISENDYDLICAWSFGDQNVFSLERMEEVLAIVNQYRPQEFSSLWDVAERFWGRGILRYPGTWCCIILAFVSLIASRNRFGISVAAGAVTVFLMLYFIYIGHSVYRVEFGYLFAAAMLIIYTMPDKSKCGDIEFAHYYRQYHGQYLSFMLGIMIILSQIKYYIPDQSYTELTDSEYRNYVDSTFNFSWDYLPEKYTKSVNDRDIRPNFFMELQSHPENLYFLDFNTTIQSLYYEFEPFESLPKKSLSNIIYLGGVTVNHPVLKETLEEWNVENELPALLQENVYFVSNTTNGLVLKFLQEHYDAGTTMTLYKVLDGYEIWSFYPSS